jgi:hypothetical protein
MNAENGSSVRHHVSTTAADILINNGLAKHGISLLNTIYNSEWVPRGSVDIAALSVYLKGYTQVRNLSGVRWVVKTALQKNMAIDRLFLDSLNASRLVFKRPSHGIRGVLRREVVNARFARELKWWWGLISQRRSEQRREVNHFGRKLVRTIVACGVEHQLPPRPSDVRIPPLEEVLTGEPEPLHGMNEPVGQIGKSSVGVAHEDSSENRATSREDPLELRGCNLDIASVPSGSSGLPKAVRDKERLKRHLLLLRRSIIMPGGKAAAFRVIVGRDST